MSKLALYVPLQAKPGKEKEVVEFLRSAVPLVNDEPGTVSWFAIKAGPSSFAIFDTFDDEAGREAHLNGGRPPRLEIVPPVTAGYNTRIPPDAGYAHSLDCPRRMRHDARRGCPWSAP
jgi:quinol monooxygenase YgiN